MFLRRALFLTLVLLANPLVNAKDKKKVILPDYVLKAHSVLIVINPDAGISPQNPNRLFTPVVEFTSLTSFIMTGKQSS